MCHHHSPTASDVPTPPEACDHLRKTLFEGFLIMNEKPPPILCWARFAWPIGCNQFPQLTGPGYSVYSSNWGSQRPKSPLTDLHFHVQILLTSTLITHFVFLCTKVLMINFPWSTFCSSDAVILRRAGVP